MTCNIILTPQNGRFLAHVAELPDCKAEAASRDQALALIQQRFEQIIQRSEIVQWKIPKLEKKFSQLGQIEKPNGASQPATEPTKQSNIVKLDPFILADDKSVHLETPWEFCGIFKDDPTWWPMFEEIERRRDRQKIPTIKKRKKK